MKRVISALVFTLLLNSCDDGNLTMETINFEDTSTQSCTTNNIIFKLKEKEALLLEMPESTFTNEPTIPGNPTLIDINNSTYRVIYRFFNGAVTSNNICNTIPPSTPTVADQWTAISGKIQIVTTTVKSTNTTDNSTRITGYNHNITFRNITFSRTEGNQVYETFPFGDYVTQPTNTIPFTFTGEVKQCLNRIYTNTSSEALIIDNIDPSLIVNTETALNTPRTALIGSTNNMLTYRLYSGIPPDGYFCITPTPTLPGIKEEWNGINGVAGISGIIEVTTIKIGTVYKHTIVIKNATLKKGNSDFKLGDNFMYGEIETND